MKTEALDLLANELRAALSHVESASIHENTHYRYNCITHATVNMRRANTIMHTLSKAP